MAGLLDLHEFWLDIQPVSQVHPEYFLYVQRQHWYKTLILCPSLRDPAQQTFTMHVCRAVPRGGGEGKGGQL